MLGGGKFANGAFSGAFVYLFNHFAGGHGAKRKYNKKVHLEHAKLMDRVAKYTGTVGALVWKYNKQVGSAILAVLGVLDGFKHMEYYLYYRKVDIVGVTIDYAVTFSVKPLGPAVGEATSQVIEETNNYLEDNYR